MAIVDRGLGPKVIQIASVSGGTITNAFVALRCRFERLSPGGPGDITMQLATKIIRQGVLTRGWIAVLLLTPIMLGVVAGVLFRSLLASWAWLAAVIGVGVALTTLIARGLAVEWLLARRYFLDTRPPKNSGHRSCARLASLSGRDVDYVFWMTDLAL